MLRNIFIIIILFTISVFQIKAQITVTTFNGKDSSNYSKDTIAKISLFTGKYINGNVYLNWVITDQHTDGIYIIYYSLDGKKFTMAGTKKGIGVAISKDIGYYLTLSTPFYFSNKIIYYQLLHLGINKSFIVSDIINIKIGQIEEQLSDSVTYYTN